ncbi:PfkB family carbohydrate kinase [Proteus mirabilis]
MITQGSKGCLVLTPTTQVALSAFTVNCVDTTGAGDAFMSGLLAAVAEYGFADDEQYLLKIITQAAACGALATTKRAQLLQHRAEKYCVNLSVNNRRYMYEIFLMDYLFICL